MNGRITRVIAFLRTPRGGPDVLCFPTVKTRKQLCNVRCPQSLDQCGKTAAKKEVKVSKFKGPETICDKPVGCMTREVNIVEHDMSDFLKSCVDAYCELAKVNVSSLSKVSTPFIGSKVS